MKVYVFVIFDGADVYSGMMSKADHTEDVMQNLTRTLVRRRNENTELETSQSPKILVVVIMTKIVEKSKGQETMYV